MKTTRKNRSRTLHCEVLEPRQMLAASAVLNGAGQLTVTGSENDDVIRLFQSGKNIYVQGVAGYWSASQVKSIRVNALGGEDYISFNSFANGGNKAIKEMSTVVGSNGTDRVHVGAANDVYFSGGSNWVSIDTKNVVYLNNVAQNLNNYATATLKSGVLTVTGTNGNNTLNFAQIKGKIYISGIGASFKASKVSQIVVRLQSGNDIVSLRSLSNGGNEQLAKYVNIYSGSGDSVVRLANGEEVDMDGPHRLEAFPNGVAKLDGVVLTWDPPEPDPDPNPNPNPNPPANWFNANIVDTALQSLGSSLYADNAINRADMLALFTSAGDNGGVDATELSDLQKIVNNSTLFAGLHYVERLSEYIVLGSTANAQFAGQALGNLVAGSTTAHLSNLVSKWFLGLDRPTASGTYRQFAGSLFVNGAAYTDINQGQIGDCYLLASLAEVALRSPSTITNMFIVNGDGTYTVRFFNNGAAEYVTVDAYLPTNGSGNAMFAGMGKNYANSANELWTMLAEKAYVQANQFGWIRPGLPGNGQNAFTGIEGGYIYAALGHITGQGTMPFAATSNGNFTTFVNAWNAGKSIGFASMVSPQSGSGVVGSHAYAVIGYNSTNQTITLYNPWGPNYATVTMTWSQIQLNFSYFDRTA